jgi:homocitrate synthase NifV
MTGQQSEPWHSPGKYNVSPYNYSEEVRSEYAFPDKLPILDATLRKMDNTPGSLIPYSVEDKLEIATILDDIGIAEVGFNPMHFYGTPRNLAIVDGLRAVARGGFKFKITTIVNWDSWTGGDFEAHADRIIDMGADTVDVEALGSEAFRAMYLRDWSWDRIRDELARDIAYVRSRGKGSGIVLGDASRGDLDQLIELTNFWIDAGADRLFIADSFGSLSPQGTTYLISKIRRGMKAPIPIVYHAHDDLGLGTANALAAAAAGAWSEASINGIGERAFAKLEEYIMALELLYGVDTGIKLERLTEVSRTVERITGIRNQPHKAVVGETMYVPLFEQEYIDLLHAGPYVSTCFDPAMVGQKPALVFWEGMLSDSTVRAKMDQMELEYNDAQVGQTVETIRTRLHGIREFPAFLSDSDVSDICRGIAG